MTTSSYTKETIDICRNVPIHKLLGSPFLNKKIKIKCPFHGERTPSCVLFPTGGFKCFGCGESGNTVDFAMKLGCSFDEAIKNLIQYT
jgi:DNA primase